jgi:hypothetical protein
VYGAESCFLPILDFNSTDNAAFLVIRLRLQRLGHISQLLKQLPSGAVGWDEALDPERINLPSVDITPRVDRYHVKPEELATVFAHVTDFSEHLAVLSIDKPDLVVHSVRDIEELLTGIRRECHTASRAAATRLGCKNELV